VQIYKNMKIKKIKKEKKVKTNSRNPINTNTLPNSSASETVKDTN